MYLSPRVISFVCFRTRYSEGSIVASPQNQERRFVVPKPTLPYRIGLDVILIVIEQVQLNISLPRLVEEVILVYPQIGIVQLGLRRSAKVPFPRRLKGQ